MRLNKKWHFDEVPVDDIDKLKKITGLSGLICKLLIRRGIVEAEEICKFLNPDLNKLHSPYLFKDMKKTVIRIREAIELVEKIVIYGDYDVDGITSSSILHNYLETKGANVSIYIPDRINEGYGLNKKAVNKLKEMGTDLIITVDCGTTSIEEVEYVKDNGIDIIITDHHECKDELPKALAVINPMREDSTYPFKKLAGVGVTYKLVAALCEDYNEKGKENGYIDIVALGTISDVVSLEDENRIITYHGLKKINCNPNIGLRELITGSRLEDKEVDEEKVGFVIAPRINAAGRMGNPRDALDLFLTDDKIQAKEIANLLDNNNRIRQQLQSEIYNEVKKVITDDNSYYNENILIVSGEGWHSGIIGIVASTISEEYNKPTIIITIEDGVGKGSGRSVKGFNLFEALNSCTGFLTTFGGHEQAAGLTIKEENIEIFRKSIVKYAERKGDDYLIPEVEIDVKLEREDVQLNTVKLLNKLAPYGEGNKKPIFLYENLKISSINCCGMEERHLKLRLRDENVEIDAIGFNLGEYARDYCYGATVDVIGYLSINDWRNKQSIQMQVIDMKKGRA